MSAPADPGQPADPPPAARAGEGRRTRRDFLRRAGIGGAAIVGGAAVGRELIPNALAAEPGTERASIGGGGGPSGPLAEPGGHAAHGPYGAAAAPPPHLGEGALDPVLVPPAPDGRPPGTRREVEITVTRRSLDVGDGARVDGWVYNGTAPGPVLRATEGDRLRITLHNRADHPHNLHLHGRHDPAADGWEPVAPGQGTVYEVEAAPFGLHPYHCHTPPLAEHVGRGLYGAFIVDPPGGRPPAHEFVLVLSGWDLDGDGRNELYSWNGVAGYFHRYPIKVPVGEPVRLYLLNMTEYDPIGSFHLHAQTFDVYWQGTALEPDLHGDTVTLAQGDRCVVEFTLPRPGRYMFHPHQHHMADRGAMGWFAAV